MKKINEGIGLHRLNWYAIRNILLLFRNHRSSPQCKGRTIRFCFLSLKHSKYVEAWAFFPNKLLENLMIDYQTDKVLRSPEHITWVYTKLRKLD